MAEARTWAGAAVVVGDDGVVVGDDGVVVGDDGVVVGDVGDAAAGGVGAGAVVVVGAASAGRAGSPTANHPADIEAVAMAPTNRSVFTGPIL